MGRVSHPSKYFFVESENRGASLGWVWTRASSALLVAYTEPDFLAKLRKSPFEIDRGRFRTACAY